MVSGSHQSGQPLDVQVLVLSVVPTPSILIVSAGGAADSMSSRVTTFFTCESQPGILGPSAFSGYLLSR